MTPPQSVRDQQADEFLWFLRPLSDAFEARLFCFPYSGCGASMYRHWPENIGPIEICPLQLPGRENRTREPHYGTYEQLANRLVDVLPPFLDRPYAFFGHCGGVLPGFETVLRLLERGQPAPMHFFVSSQVAPHEGPYGRFLQLSRQELAQELHKMLREMTGEEIMPEMVEFLLEILIADVKANKQYHKSAPIRLPCPITAFGWSHDTEVDPQLMGGWQDCGQTRFQVLAGEHFSFLSLPDHLKAEIRHDMEVGLAR